LFGSAVGQGVRRAGYNIESGAADKAGDLIKPGEIKDLANKMLPDFKAFAQQMASGDKDGAKKTGEKLESQLKGMGEESMKRIVGLVGDTVKLTKEQVEMFTHVGNAPATNTTQTTSQQSQEPKGSFMQQLGGNAFDNVNQGKAGESQPVTSSQVSNLNNQTVNTTNNNQQTSTNQSNVLTDVMSKALPPQIVEHKFDGTITIKVDAPPGVDTAYITKTVTDTVNKRFKDEKIMADNYGLTSSKVSELRNSSGNGFG
jgi:hypothetical protein